MATRKVRKRGNFDNRVYLLAKLREVLTKAENLLPNSGPDNIDKFFEQAKEEVSQRIDLLRTERIEESVEEEGCDCMCDHCMGLGD